MDIAGQPCKLQLRPDTQNPYIYDLTCRDIPFVPMNSAPEISRTAIEVPVEGPKLQVRGQSIQGVWEMTPSLRFNQFVCQNRIVFQTRDGWQIRGRYDPEKGTLQLVEARSNFRLRCYSPRHPT